MCVCPFPQSFVLIDYDPFMSNSSMKSGQSLIFFLTLAADPVPFAYICFSFPGVHIMMMDLMPPGTYFRFNPYLSDDLQLDEIRQDRLDGMLRDTSMYLRKNERKMQKAVETLKQGRLAHQHAMDWVKFKADCLV